MPSQFLPISSKDLYRKDLVMKAKGLNLDIQINEYLKSKHDAAIHYCEIANPQLKLDVSPESIKNRKVIVYVAGNSGTFEENSDEILRSFTFTNNKPQHPLYSNAHNTIVVAFNFRNVQLSKGTVSSAQSWVDDFVAVIEHYLDQGIQLNNILIHGYSLGGAIATVGAAQIYERECSKEQYKDALDSVPCMKLINNRSLSSITDELLHGLFPRWLSVGFSALALGGLSSFFLPSSLAMCCGFSALITGIMDYNLVSRFTYPLAQSAIYLSLGELNATEAYKKLPRKAKDHIVTIDDGVIRHGASLHYSNKELNSFRKKLIKAEMQRLDLPENERLELESELLNMKDSKLYHRNLEGELTFFQSHVCGLEHLHTYHKLRPDAEHLSGEVVYYNKIDRLLQEQKYHNKILKMSDLELEEKLKEANNLVNNNDLNFKKNLAQVVDSAVKSIKNYCDWAQELVETAYNYSYDTAISFKVNEYAYALQDKIYTSYNYFKDWANEYNPVIFSENTASEQAIEKDLAPCMGVLFK